jgi:hypothetical protein
MITLFSWQSVIWVSAQVERLVLVHHTVKKSAYDFANLWDELMYTVCLADTNSAHLANSFWLDYSDCSVWFPFSGFYLQFGVITYNHVLWTTWNYQISSDTKEIKRQVLLAIPLFPFALTLSGCLLHINILLKVLLTTGCYITSFLLQLVSLTVVHIKIVSYTIRCQMSCTHTCMHACYFPTSKPSNAVPACCDFTTCRPSTILIHYTCCISGVKICSVILVCHYIFLCTSHLYSFINF